MADFYLAVDMPSPECHDEEATCQPIMWWSIPSGAEIGTHLEPNGAGFSFDGQWPEGDWTFSGNVELTDDSLLFSEVSINAYGQAIDGLSFQADAI